MIQTETPKAKILLVEVPVGKEFWINNNFLHIGDVKGDAHSIILPKENWSILNTLKDVSEEEAERVADRITPPAFTFTNPLGQKHCIEHLPLPYKESLHSLASSLNIKEGNVVILYELKK